MNLNENNHIILKDVLSKEVCTLLSDYLKFKANLHPNRKKHDALANVHREYGDIMMETLLDKLTKNIEKATGLELWPTLSFYYVYQNGHYLTPHKDRSSCQIVAGICLGMDENYQKAHQTWPLILEQNDTANAIALDIGDILIFKGHDTLHWREKFTGEYFISAIFGFVDKNDQFHFQKFDQRKKLGLPHVGMFNWFYGYLKYQIKHYFFMKK